MLYSIATRAEGKTFPLGTYLGEVTDHETVDYIRGLHPTLARALLFKNKDRANYVATFLNDEYTAMEFFVIEVDETEDSARRVNYTW